MTNTELMLQAALAICQKTTGREEVSDELLCSVFNRLHLETEHAFFEQLPVGDESTTVQ